MGLPIRNRFSPRRFLLAPVILAAATLATASRVPDRNGSKAESGEGSAGAEALATFAGGCFWCMEPPFEKQEGVVSVTSGYAGGPEINPSYEQVSAGKTGHREAVQIIYDPKRITYARLLQIFWRSIDPTQYDGQFCDRGKQYRSAVFYRSETERTSALDSKRKLEASPKIRKPFVTEILPFTSFYPAEGYHQDYYKKNPEHYQSYRLSCGRDRRLRELWGTAAKTR